MHRILLGFMLLAAPCIAMATPHYAVVSVPCEEMLKEVRASQAADKLSHIEHLRVNSLQMVATERCDAGDYVTADRILSEAMDIMDE